jgi:pantothenate kinase
MTALATTWVGEDVGGLVDRICTMLDASPRVMIGITGPPGSGKSTLADLVCRQLTPTSALVPMDGFHLADSELARLGRLDRKGAPDTFDAAGFVNLLQRIRSAVDQVVYAPVFVREQEQAIAGALPVPSTAEVVIVEGNYLLAGEPYGAVRDLLDECWYVDPPNDLRLARLIARHVSHGRTQGEAEAWVQHTDEPNAQLIASTRHLADLVVRPVAEGAGACAD